jgi:hypothetical protein
VAHLAPGIVSRQPEQEDQKPTFRSRVLKPNAAAPTARSAAEEKGTKDAEDPIHIADKLPLNSFLPADVINTLAISKAFHVAISDLANFDELAFEHSRSCYA